MELYREDRLRKIHREIGVQKRIGGFVGQIVPIQIAAGNQDILRNCPASVTDIEEHQKMLKQPRSFLTGQSLCTAVRLKDAVSVPHREGERIRRLLQAHQLPEKQERLDCLEERFRAVLRDTAECVLQQFQLCTAGGGGSLHLRMGQICVPVR